MNITIALDVATGLALLYLILSLLCTTLNEFVATLLKLRSRNLKATIQELIDDPNLFADFYGHGLIGSSRVASKAGTIKANQPPPPARASNFFGRTFAWIKGVWCSSHPSYLDSKDVAMALIDLLGRGAPPAPPGIAQSRRTLEEIRQAVLAKPSTYSINNVLSACVTEASGDLNKLRDGIAAWFDNAMDRLSGAYKRKIQLVTFAIALLVAVVLNADTVHVAQVLWQDPPLAAKLAQPAETWSKGDLSNLHIPANPVCQNPDDASSDQEKSKSAASKLVKPDHTASTTAKPGGNGANKAKSDSAASDPVKEAHNLCLLNAQARAFPIGWTKLTWQWAKSPLHWEQWQWTELLGLLMTTVALSLGAPFWFDFLGKLVNLRGTGKKPERTKAPT